MLQSNQIFIMCFQSTTKMNSIKNFYATALVLTQRTLKWHEDPRNSLKNIKMEEKIVQLLFFHNKTEKKIWL